MACYMRFCSCQLRAATLLQHKVQDPRFDAAVRLCQSDQRAGGMPLSSFLLKPTQRVTKYPLLIKQVTVEPHWTGGSEAHPASHQVPTAHQTGNSGITLDGGLKPTQRVTKYPLLRQMTGTVRNGVTEHWTADLARGGG